MFKKTAASLAMVATIAFAPASAYASQVRPAAVQLNKAPAKSVAAQGRIFPASTRPGKSNKETSGFLIPLLVGVAVAVAVAAAAGGGDSSPN